MGGGDFLVPSFERESAFSFCLTFHICLYELDTIDISSSLEKVVFCRNGLCVGSVCGWFWQASGSQAGTKMSSALVCQVGRLWVSACSNALLILFVPLFRGRMGSGNMSGKMLQ